MEEDSELTGPQLDAAVAKALGWVQTRSIYDDKPLLWDTGGGFYRVEGRGLKGDLPWTPSRSWDQAGPIIETKRIEIGFMGAGHGWQAAVNPKAQADWLLKWHDGPTPLIAAMRAYVASKGA